MKLVNCEWKVKILLKAFILSRKFFLQAAKRGEIVELITLHQQPQRVQIVYKTFSNQLKRALCEILTLRCIQLTCEMHYLEAMKLYLTNKINFPSYIELFSFWMSVPDCVYRRKIFYINLNLSLGHLSKIIICKLPPIALVLFWGRVDEQKLISAFL